MTVRTPLRVALAAADALAFGFAPLPVFAAGLGLVPVILSDIVFRKAIYQCAMRNGTARY